LPRLSLAWVVALALITPTFLLSPAEAAQVILKNGRLVSGVLRVAPAGVTVTAADGKVEVLPYASIAGISLDDEPLYVPARAPEAPKLGQDNVLVWAMLATNVVTMLLAGLALYRAASPTPSTP
jgi:hypothetical protein